MVLLIVVAIYFVTTRPNDATIWKKVETDMGQFDADGLRGPTDGKVAVSYEFCIPDNDVNKNQVRNIDQTVQFMSGSRGRIGALPQQCLCIGSTGQKNFRKVLFALASLPYIDRIIVCDFEYPTLRSTQ